MYKKWIYVILAIIGIGLVHLIYWLLTKGTIWIMLELANVNWYGKFWAVYVALIILTHIFKTININKRG